MTTLATMNSETKNALQAIELSQVNTAKLNTVGDALYDITSAMLKCSQFNTGLTLTFIEYLYTLKVNYSQSIKATQYGNFGKFVDSLFGLDKAQTSRYTNMYYILYVDTVEPYEELTSDKGYSIAQLCAISNIKDRAVREYFIKNHVKPTYSCTAISNAVKYLNTITKLNIDVIDGKYINELLNGSCKFTTEKNTQSTQNTQNEKLNTKHFTTFEEFQKWVEQKAKSKRTTFNITVTYEVK